MEHTTQSKSRVGILLGLVLASLALLAIFAVAASALSPAGQSQTNPSPSLGQTYFKQTGVGPDVGPMGDRRVGVIGRNRLPEAQPGFTATVLVISGLLAAALAVIALATAVVDRRYTRQLAELGPPARFRPRQERESHERAA